MESNNMKQVEAYLSKGEYVMAFKELSEDAYRGNIASIANLAMFYAKGIGVEQSYVKALELFTQSVCFGAKASLIREILFEHIPENDLFELANLGNGNAQYYYAMLCAIHKEPDSRVLHYLDLACLNKMPIALANKGLQLYITNLRIDKCIIDVLTDAIDAGFDFDALLKHIVNNMESVGFSLHTEDLRYLSECVSKKKMSRNFCLAKITRNEYAEGFIKQGKVYTQPLKNFRLDPQPGIGDAFEGVGNTGCNIVWEDILQEEAVKDFCGCGMYDDYMAHERLLCLYALEFNENLEFIKPDLRVRQLGDTIIIIRDTEEFIRRYQNALKHAHGNTWLGYQRVEYCVDFERDRIYNEFSKTLSYSWQNEFRFVEDIANGRCERSVWDNMSDLSKLNCPVNPNDLYEESGGQILEMGDLSDICCSFPVDEFVSLSKPILDCITKAKTGNWAETPLHTKPYIYKPFLLF